jgi:CubicO group peptidase (beta-lactamase class C family)
MQDTYVYSLSDSAKAMMSYYQSGRPFRMEFLDLVYGDKNVYSTVRDLYKWDQALRNGQLFSKGVLDSAYAGYSFEKPGQRNYGLGWRMLFIPNGKKLIYHNGWWHGNRTVFIRMLDENATIIALSNNDYKYVYSAKRLCDLFGDYRQSHESFDEGESDPTSDPGPGGEPREPIKFVTPPAHHPIHHRAKKTPVHPVKKKTVSPPAQ